MSPAEQERKLRMIAELSADQLEGWESVASVRGYFDGEIAAITARKKALKVKA